MSLIFCLLLGPNAIADDNVITKESTSQEPVTQPISDAELPKSLQWTSESSWQPKKGEVFVSVFEIQYAPTSWLSLHSLTIPWFYSGSSIGARFPMYRGERFSFGAGVSYLSLDLTSLLELEDAGVRARFTLTPINLYGTWRVRDNILLGVSLRRNEVLVGGANTDTEVVNIQGAASTSNSHLRFQFGWGFSEKWSLWIISNHLTNQEATGYNYSEVDLENGAKIQFYLEAETDSLNFTDASSLGFRLFRRGKAWAFTTGLDFGHVPLYTLGFVPPQKIILPYLNLGRYF